MSKGRLEAFSDGVIAILITIMVLELHAPEGVDAAALSELMPIFLSYVLSFVFLGIYWNNHHHLLQLAKHVNGGVLWANLHLLFWLSLIPFAGVLWANLHLLFWLSLIPFATAWMGENSFAQLPIALYGLVLWMSGLAYYILAQKLISLHGNDSLLATALGRKIKEITSLVSYAVAILLSFFSPPVSLAIYVFVACLWLIPDQRIEKSLIR